MSEETQEKLLLIDGFNLLSRCYFATAYGKEWDQLTRNSQGLFINGLRAKIQKLLQLVRIHEPTHLAIAWDVKRNETLRKEKFQDYKGTRNELPEPLIQQYETAVTLFNTLGLPQFTIPRYEADDIIGTFTQKWRDEKQGECIVYSNDRDLLQLLCEQTSQLIAAKKGEIKYTVHDFRDDYGIEPSQWVDVKALLGDKSDNIPGVAGVGEKAALPLVQQYGSVEGIYESVDELDVKYKRYFKKLQLGREMAFLSRDLCEIYRDVPDIVDLNFDDIRIKVNRSLLKDELSRLEINVRVG
ncbi:5'-3' exonuclease [Fictibacillus sp. S7]|uniref:5'-3' exonuclease n=2 Tax=Fictibacillus TaxID=1329200 RepID=A0A0V8JDP6_9BACL|nr:5'-3' exonuclease [Fictibacillus enclensis]KSU85250.1 5'-3' exonuclease [Fictibacillus enclensis]RXZ02568.1 5'-3' exonuclease [Fictibacillus sp. S7]SCB93724.1 5'-3' exonuclease [Fictibacillus enclensis]